jgi:hypothetical protein
MGFRDITEAVTWLEKANADLEPELLSADAARDELALYARAEKLAAYGKTVLARKLDDPVEVARATGVSVGKARAALDTGQALTEADEVRDAFKDGAISLDQAGEIARAEQASPGSSSELLAVAQNEAFHVLRDKARKTVLEAEQGRGLAERQHQARSARSHTDELGMVHIDLSLEPHLGVPISNRAEAEAARLQRQARKDGSTEPFERYLADAYAALLSGGSSTPSRKPELVVLVSHEVATRGWKDVKGGELARFPGSARWGLKRPRGSPQMPFLPGCSSMARISVTCAAGPATRRSRSWWPWSWENRPGSTASSASTVAIAFGPRKITWNRMSPKDRHRRTTSGGGAIRATRRRPNETARRAS